MMWFFAVLYVVTAVLVYMVTVINVQVSRRRAFTWAVTWPFWSTGLIMYLYAMTTYDRFKTIFGKKDKA